MNPREHLPAARIADRRKAPRPEGGGFLSGLLGRLRKRGGSVAGSARPACFVVAVMVLVDKGVPVDGLVTGLDIGEATFRPASVYILDRTGGEVVLRFAGREVRGVITGVSPRGYDVVFNMPLPTDFVADLIRDFGAAGGFGRG